jgi:hypothetical protein
LIFFGQLFGACSGGGTNNANISQPNSNQYKPVGSTANDKVEELELLVTLPIEPEETVWREDAPVAGDNSQPPFTKKLTAVLKYSQADAVKLSGLIEQGSPPLSVGINTETWFPAELIAQSDLSGDDTLKGDSYSAANFYRAPYSDGRITRVEGTDYFVLELYSR